MVETNGNGEVGARPRLFLSYTRKDVEPARKIIAVLEDAGFEVWWDALLEGGVNYLPTTEAALEAADCVVVLWSKLSVDSSWVRDEAQSGRERGRLVPVSLDGTMSPLGFRQIQLIDINFWDGTADAPEMARIITAINGLIAAEGKITPAAAATSSPLPISTVQTAVSRRNLVLGGAGLALAAGALGAWQGGLLDGLGSASGDGKMSMAVLRFANLTGDEEQSWFSDGLSNELRQALSRNPRLRVSAPTSSTARPDEDDFEVARALGVENILRGSVQRADETVRIFAELVEVDGGLVRWSESFDRAFDDVLAVQTEIAETVALALVAEVASQSAAMQSIEAQKNVGGTNDIAAYEAYLRGYALADLSAGIDSDRAALVQFEAAIAADPTFAAAHAWQATMFSAIANATSDAEEVRSLYTQAITAAQQAIDIEPALARGHLALGFALSNGQLDLGAALPHYQRADELAPGDADIERAAALFYIYIGQRSRALELIEDALDLDPLNARAFRTGSFIALLAHDYPRLLSYAEKALELNPQLASVHYAIGCARLMMDDLDGAVTAFEAEPVDLFARVGLAIARHRQGDTAAAQAEFQSMLDEYGDASLYQQALVHAQWGDSASALAVLERAFEVRDPGVLFAPNDPLLDPLRGTDRFEQLLLRLRA